MARIILDSLPAQCFVWKQIRHMLTPMMNIRLILRVTHAHSDSCWEWLMPRVTHAESDSYWRWLMPRVTHAESESCWGRAWESSLARRSSRHLLLRSHEGIKHVQVPPPVVLQGADWGGQAFQQLLIRVCEHLVGVCCVVLQDRKWTGFRAWTAQVSGVKWASFRRETNRFQTCTFESMCVAWSWSMTMCVLHMQALWYYGAA